MKTVFDSIEDLAKHFREILDRDSLTFIKIDYNGYKITSDWTERDIFELLMGIRGDSILKIQYYVLRYTFF